MITHPMKRYPKLLWIISLAAGVAGCASAPSRFYTLVSTAKASGAPLADCAVVVEPVFLPSLFDRPQFVAVTSPNRVEFDEFNRWAAPLSEIIACVVGDDLGKLLGTTRVTSAPLPGFGPAYYVAIRVERFEFVRPTGTNSGVALVDALWTVRTPADKNLASGRTLAREPVPDGATDALVAAYSRSLAKVSGDIAAAIRPPPSENK